MNFNSVFRKSLPSVGFAGDLYFTNDDGRLYLALPIPQAYRPGQTYLQQQQAPHLVYLQQLGYIKILVGLSVDLPASAEVGSILLTKDKLRGYAGMGDGLPLTRFFIEVSRVLESGATMGEF